MNTLLCNGEHFFLTSSAYKLSLEVCGSILLLNVHEKVRLILILLKKKMPLGLF